MTDAQITVILPVYNGGPLLVRQLLALLLEARSSVFGLLVIDNRSTDGSADVARAVLDRFEAPFDWRVIPAFERQSLGYARNVGGTAVATELMCYCDQDDIVTPGWVVGHIEAGSLHDLWTGRIVGTVLNHRRTPGTDGPNYAETKVLGFLPSVAGSNFGLSKGLFDTMGGFSETIPSCEDLEFSWRAQLDYDVTIGRADGSVVLRQYRRGAMAVYQQGRWYGAGQEWLRKRYQPHGMLVEGWNRRLLLRLLRELPAAARADAAAVADVAHTVGLLRGRMRTRALAKRGAWSTAE